MIAAETISGYPFLGTYYFPINTALALIDQLLLTHIIICNTYPYLF